MEKTVVQIDLITLEEGNYHLFIDAKIGRKKARFLIDTGASKTVMDKDQILKFVGSANINKHQAQSVGLGADKMETEVAIFKTMAFNNVKLKNIEVAVLNLNHVNQTYQMINIPIIDGVLGSDLLVALNAVINYPKKQLTLKIN